MLRSILVVSGLLLVLGGCDNVGRAFDPNVTPGGPTPGSGESIIQVVPIGGDVRDGRPKVKEIQPTDGGWPATVPVVIEFNESVNEASIAPTSPNGTDGRIILRVLGTTTALPCLYDFVAGGKVLVMRPVTALSNEGSPSYEVVLLPEARDVDGLRFQVSGDEEILATFQVNQDTSFTDGRILMTSPRDNKTDASRESDYLVFFDRPANLSSINEATNFVLRQNGVAVAGSIDIPLQILGQDDVRAVRFVPDALLAADQRYEFVVEDTITFGASGKLDYGGGTPYAVFDTIGPQAPTEVHVGNPTVGFDDKINRQNQPSVVLHVTTSADTQAGDRVLARIYGGDRETSETSDIAFVEAEATAPVAGVQTVVVDFAGKLGQLADPKFDDGAITFAVQSRRGSEQSAFAQSDPDDVPWFDVTVPTLTRVGPPGESASNDIYTDLEHLALHGTASEELGEATLTDGVNPAAGMFASQGNGFFLMNPVQLGRLTAPRGYTLTITDLAGNMAEAAITGSIRQRGMVTGTVAGTLTVEAFDHATLAPIANATVLVDPGVPTVPATGQLTATTDANGIATFSGLATTQHTVTIVAAGYDLATFMNTAAARVSLPLRPMTDPVATFSGDALFQPSVGSTVLVGNSAIDDPLQLGIATTSTSPLEIPATSITPNRPQVLTAFGGNFEPIAVPAFAYHGYQMLGPTFLTAEPPEEPAAPGGASKASIVLAPATGTTANLAVAYAKDFGAAAGLDVGDLVGGGPIVRVTASLLGFGGQVLGGVGVATLTSGASYLVDATYGLPLATGLVSFSPSFWVVAEARDNGGRVSRHRTLLVTLLGTVIDVAAVPSIPVITAPAGPAARLL